MDPEGQVWHELAMSPDVPLPEVGLEVSCQIDWPRRFDHMQQHTGEHILAYCVHLLLSGFTHGLHIGQEDSTIDVTLPEGRTRLTEEEEQQLEDMANQLVAEDLPVTCRYPDADEMATLPLRKPPTVKEDIRVCFIGQRELCACGGTHLSHSAQVGLVRVLSSQPARGKLRISFLCGLRAARHARVSWLSLVKASNLLNVPTVQVPERAAALLLKTEELKKELASLKEERLLQTVPQLLGKAQALPGDLLLVSAHFPEEDLTALPQLATELIKADRVVALLSCTTGSRLTLLFARSEGLPLNLAEVMKHLPMKGGGKPDFVRGMSDDPDILSKAKTAIEQGIH